MLPAAAVGGVFAAGVEVAPLGHLPGVGHHALDGLQPLGGAAQPGQGPDEPFGIGVEGLLEKGLHRGGLHHLPGVDHHHPVAEVVDDAQVVGDHDDAHVPVLLEVLHELEDLGLNGDIQSGGGLIGDEELRVAGQGNGDHHPLAHTAGELVGILLHALLRVRDAAQLQELKGPGHGLLLGGLAVEQDALGDLFAHGVDGVQGGHGLLEDHGDLIAPDLLHLPLRELEQVPALKEDLALDVGRGLGQQAHGGQRGDALSGA